MQRTNHDVIIVGGGSAGCVVGGRLSEDPRRRVLLLEAGRDDRPGAEPASIRDLAVAAPYHADNVWPGLSVRWTGRPAADGAVRPRQPYLQARVIGGGSSVNAMAAPRGLPGDFDHWEALGAEGWGARDVLPVFAALESDRNFEGAGHSKDGRLPIRRIPRAEWPPFTQAVAEELLAIGHEWLPDVNGATGDGVGPMPLMSTPAQRVTTAMAYLDASARRRDNLSILDRTRVTHLLFEGRRAIGVLATGPHGSREHRASEIVLCAGALQTPILLLQSGVGCASELEAVGVPLTLHLPAVGRNLHDHPFASIGVLLTREARQTAEMKTPNCIYVRATSRVADAEPGDLFFGALGKVAWHPLGLRLASVNVAVYSPRSRGRIRLAPGAGGVPTPEIDFELLRENADLERLADGFRRAAAIVTSPRVRPLLHGAFPAAFSRRVMRINQFRRRNWLLSRAMLATLDAAGPLRSALLDRIIAPGPPLGALVDDPAQLADWLLRHATGFFHPVGTCRMGRGADPEAVADSAGRVHGLTGLRIADASLMPGIVRANTNLTTIMIAERIATAIVANS